MSLLVQVFGANDDQVLVRKSREEEVYKKNFEVEEDDHGNKVMVGEETDEVRTDEDGNAVTKEKMFDVNSYMAMRPVELNFSDKIVVNLEFDPDVDSWQISVRPFAEVFEFQEYAEIASLPEGWDMSLKPVPDDVSQGDPFGGFALMLTVPDEDEEDFFVEKL